MEPTANPPTEASPPPAAPALPPRAKIVPERRWSWAWLAPVAAALFVAYLVYQSWEPVGPSIVIHFDEGHGLKPGAVLRHRGVVIGEVRDVNIAPDLKRIDVAVDLKHEAAPIARHGSRFWIVRPRIDFGAVEGLDTIIGPNYLAVIPGDGPKTLEFNGHEEQPLDERIEPGGLELTLQSAERGGLRPGAAIYYRQFRVGTILTVGLAADGSAVESRAYIRPSYRDLLRENTRFWNVGAIDVDAGWFRGLTVEMATVEELLRGGVAFATPLEAGAPIVDGHRYVVAPRAEEEWRSWSPSLSLTALDRAQSPPSPMRAVLTWKHDGAFRNPQRRQEGYVLRVPEGFLGLADLLTVPEDSFADSVQVAIAGKAYAIHGRALHVYDGLALLPREHKPADKPSPWPTDRMRKPGAPEDCLAFINATGEPRTIAAGRCVENERGWAIDSAVPFDAEWHGAAIIAVRDAKLLGFLAWKEDHAEVIPLRNGKRTAATK